MNEERPASEDAPAAQGTHPRRGLDALADPLNQVTHLSEETAQKLIGLIENSQPLRRLRSSQIATALIGSVGLALFIVGVEGAAQDFPVISNPYGSVFVGLLFLAASGLLLKRLAGGGD